MTQEQLQTLRMTDQYKGNDKQITHKDFVKYAEELHYGGVPHHLFAALKQSAKDILIEEAEEAGTRRR